MFCSSSPSKPCIVLSLPTDCLQGISKSTTQQPVTSKVVTTTVSPTKLTTTTSLLTTQATPCTCVTSAGRILPRLQSTLEILPGNCIRTITCSEKCSLLAPIDRCANPTTTPVQTLRPSPIPNLFPTLSSKKCSCNSNGRLIPESGGINVEVTKNCRQKHFCLRGCDKVIKLSVICDKEKPTAGPQIPAWQPNPVWQPTQKPISDTCICSWAGKAFTGVIPTTRCSWVRCVKTYAFSTAGECRPKHIFSCTHPDTGLDPKNGQWVTAENHKTWGTWETSLFNGAPRKRERIPAGSVPIKARPIFPLN